LNPRYADAHKLLLHVHVREGSDDAIAHIEAMRRSPTGLDNAAINLIEAELTASIGRFDRMATLVMSSMQENSVEGTEVLAHAAAVLLRDHEYQEVEELCDIVQQRMQATTPAIVPILQGRALTMLGRFEEASRLFEPLERDPALLTRQLRSTLAGWADDAREYPVMLSTLNSVPGPRQRFDLARILAISGADPAIWVPLFNTDGLNPNESVNW